MPRSDQGEKPALVNVPSHSADIVLPRKVRLPISSARVIVIGASTGGTEALKVVLEGLPLDTPPILIAQHMPESFTQSFSQRLDSICRIHVKQAEDGERLQMGNAYIAPGHSHLLLSASGPAWTCTLSQAPPVNRHRPSVDVLFRSAANLGGANIVGVILTGMGRDGALGMKEMRDAGASTLAQDEASCVVFGMPKEAIMAGGVQEVLPLKDIAARMLALSRMPVRN